MKVSYSWLQEVAPDLQAPLEELVERAAMLGFPVEELRSLSEGLQDVVVANVLSVRPHPSADRLRLCRVDGGAGEVQVVCGAPNVDAGGWYPFAPVGASLPGGTRIGKAKLRGEVSEGMLCSERELGLGPGKDGLMVLPGPLRPGASLVESIGLDDFRLDVEVTANRGDLLSHEGIARELGPGGHVSLRLPPVPGEDGAALGVLEALRLATDPQEAAGGGVAVRIDAPALCARYLGLVVRGIRVGPSPPWLQSRIRAVGAKPINNVVDATNYALLELGQPLHAFDLAKVGGGRIVVRTARAGETIRTLDGVERALAPDMLAICDVERPVAVAGVMGGADSEVTEDTVDVLLECALFQPTSIRSTRKALGLSTDASYRFERGVDPEGMVRALLRAARVILATAGGSVEGPIADCAPRSFARSRVTLRAERVERVLGMRFEPETLTSLLTHLGFAVTNSGDAGGSALEVGIPGFRSYDVTREVDLIEEVARLHGYDRFPDEPRPFRTGTVPDHPLFCLEDELRDELTGWGFFEAQTPAFAPEGEVEILNPVSADERFLRATLLPGLARGIEHNAARGNRDVRLFELGTAFRRGEPGAPPSESTHLALLMHGRRAAQHWSGEATPLDLWDLKGILGRVVGRLSGDGWVLSADRPTGETGGGLPDCATYFVYDGSGALVGAGGQMASDRLDLPPWAGEVWAAEVTLPAEPKARPVVAHQPVPAYPGVERDLAVLVPTGVRVDAVLGVARARGGEHLAELAVFDVYRNESMPPGDRSVAVRLRFRAADRTLRDDEVDEAVRSVVRALEEDLRVRVRGQTG